MQIITYRELRQKDRLLPLFDHAFRWPFIQRTFDRFVRSDPRSKDSPVGFCAVENDLAVGFVGVLNLSTRTLDGHEEVVGGVYGVATLPSHVRKGVSTLLMNRAHEHFEEKGFRFSFLTTSRTLIAHAFYEKLGYTDIVQYPSAYKSLVQKKSERSRMRKTEGMDSDRILRIYNRYVQGRVGFVVRDAAHLKMLRKGERITAKQCIVSEEGYAIFRKDREGVWVKELVALNAGIMEKLVSELEQQARDVVYDRIVLDDTLRGIYANRGYMIHTQSHSVLMVKSLTADTSPKRAYGDRFYMTALDWF
jgi:GNAT superfamily N-acetyltransferase